MVCYRNLWRAAILEQLLAPEVNVLRSIVPATKLANCSDSHGDGLGASGRQAGRESLHANVVRIRDLASGNQTDLFPAMGFLKSDAP